MTVDAATEWLKCAHRAAAPLPRSPRWGGHALSALQPGLDISALKRSFFFLSPVPISVDADPPPREVYLELPLPSTFTSWVSTPITACVSRGTIAARLSYCWTRDPALLFLLGPQTRQPALQRLKWNKPRAPREALCASQQPHCSWHIGWEFHKTAFRTQPPNFSFFIFSDELSYSS